MQHLTAMVADWDVISLLHEISSIPKDGYHFNNTKNAYHIVYQITNACSDALLSLRRQKLLLNNHHRIVARCFASTHQVTLLIRMKFHLSVLLASPGECCSSAKSVRRVESFTRGRYHSALTRSNICVIYRLRRL